MKNNIYLLLLLVIGLGSCSKNFLDQQPNTSSVQSETYFNSISEIEGATIAEYRLIDYDGWWQTQWWRMVSGVAASDDAWVGVNGGQGTAIQAAHYTLNAQNDRLEAHWIEVYKSIYAFNAIIEGIEGSSVDEKAKQPYIAELKFLRAFQYWDLVRNWGAVPLITKTLSINENTYSRTSPADIYAFLKTDLLSAIESLPLKSEYNSANKFRVSKGAAQALLAKIDLYAADWAGAAEMAGKVIASGEYSLEKNFGDVWKTTNFNGKESIFEIQFQYSPQYPGLANNFVIATMASSEGGWGYFTPTSDLENAFKSEGDSIRLNWTIIRNGFPVVGDPANPSFDGVPANNKSARFGRKTYIPRGERTPGGFTRDHIYLRLADIYLIKAEADAMLHKTPESLAALKAVRDRVNLDTDMSLSGWDLIHAVRLERRLELAMEGGRLYDIRRWKDEQGKPVINSIFGPDGSFVKYNTEISKDPYETTNSNEAQNKGYNFVAGKHNLWPIPTSEILSSKGKITQNPGY